MKLLKLFNYDIFNFSDIMNYYEKYQETLVLHSQHNEFAKFRTGTTCSGFCLTH